MKYLTVSALFIAAASLANCTNIDLLEKLEKPGAIKNEVFTNNYYVFVSSWTTLGHMGGSPYGDCLQYTGANRADCACTKAAIGQGLRRSGSHVFRAWLSTSSSNAICRVQGLGNGCITAIPFPWFNTQGQIIVNDFGGFAGTTIPNAIRFDEFKLDQGPNLVWTGTNVGGTVAASTHCSDWTDMTNAGTGVIGDRTGSTTANMWTQSTPNQTCDTSQRIYCVASPIF